MSKSLRDNRGFLISLMIAITGSGALYLNGLRYSWYRAGLGEVDQWDGFLPCLSSMASGALFFVVLIFFTIRESGENSRFNSVLKIVLSALVLIFPIFSEMYLSGEPGYIQYSKGFLKRVEINCNEKELRDWAVDFIDRFRDQPESYDATDLKQVPEFIWRITPDKKIIREHNLAAFRFWITDKAEIEYLVINWGGGLSGYWGLEIGPRNLTLESDSRAYRIEWKPGIYVWYEQDD